MIPDPDFYRQATARNLGLFTEAEQERLRNSTVAIAGMGAVGGQYLLALARMGVGGFQIADPERFEVVNLHRQAGAFTHTLGEPKAQCLARMARSINPEIRVRVLDAEITGENAEDFLRGADLYLDGMDFFQIDARRRVYQKVRERGLHAILAAPIGYGASLHLFGPQGMPFDTYFGISDQMTRAERITAFGLGLLPGLGAAGAVNPAYVDAEQEKGPALISSVLLCASLAVTAAMQILLNREAPACVPHASYFDPYRGRLIHRAGFHSTWRARLMRWLAMRRYPSLLRLHREERYGTSQHPSCHRLSVPLAETSSRTGA